MGQRFKTRYKLAKYLIERGLSTGILSHIARRKMVGMTDEQQEALSEEILDLITDCSTQDDIISKLGKRGYI